MTDSDIYAEFEYLWEHLEEIVERALLLDVPDPSIIKVAIAGFRRHQAAEEWKKGHLDIVVQHAKQLFDLDAEDLELEFSMMAHGALLGLYSSGKIDDRLYRIGYILITGFVMKKLQELDD